MLCGGSGLSFDSYVDMHHGFFYCPLMLNTMQYIGIGLFLDSFWFKFKIFTLLNEVGGIIAKFGLLICIWLPITCPHT